MGKNGAALRERKLQTSTYTFTRAQLEEHDQLVIKARIEKIRADLMEQMEKDFAQKAEEANRAIEEEWKRREELFKGDDWSSNFFLLLSLLLAVSSRVLVERFGWAPLPRTAITTIGTGWRGSAMQWPRRSAGSATMR